MKLSITGTFAHYSIQIVTKTLSFHLSLSYLFIIIYPPNIIDQYMTRFDC